MIKMLRLAALCTHHPQYLDSGVNIVGGNPVSDMILQSRLLRVNVELVRLTRRRFSIRVDESRDRNKVNLQKTASRPEITTEDKTVPLSAGESGCHYPAAPFLISGALDNDRVDQLAVQSPAARDDIALAASVPVRRSR